MKFGEIYTNGINYWMVTYVSKPLELCNNPNHVSFYSNRHELRPVVMRKNGEPSHFVGVYNGQLSDIKPYARLVGKMVFEKTYEFVDEGIREIEKLK